MEDKFEALARKIEEQNVILKRREFKSFFNQPDYFSISSKNSQVDNVLNNPFINDSFYRFSVDLPKNILEPKGLQLAGINFPQANATSFNDTELVFYYYRIKTQQGNDLGATTVFAEQPNVNNMYIVRLLPSWYKQELIPNADNYAFNKTFNNYQELSDELAKACVNDLAGSSMPFISGDITISYNEKLNKFQMKGNNTTAVWTPRTYLLTPQETNQLNDIVSYVSGTYISLTNNNQINPALIIIPWASSVRYYRFNVALLNGVYYTAILSNQNSSPTNPSTVAWLPSLFNPSTNYGGTRKGFNVLLDNIWYVSLTDAANIGHYPDEPGSTYWRIQPIGTITLDRTVIITLTNWISTTDYVVNNVVLWTDGLNYKAKFNNTNIPPTGHPDSGLYWAIVETNLVASIYIPPQFNYDYSYVPKNLVLYAGEYWTCKLAVSGIDPTSPSGSTYWVSSVWSSSINYFTISPANVLNFPVILTNKWYSQRSVDDDNEDNSPDVPNSEYWNDGNSTIEYNNLWEVYAGTFGYSYLGAGYEDPNIKIVSQNVTTISEAVDWLYVGRNIPKLVGIPPQPLTQTSTLNKRLGYTWNGLYSDFPSTVFNVLDADNSYFPLLYNRIRPVPYYEEIPPGFTVSIIPNNPYTQTIYTFDGYCNLVYSSILYVYSDMGFSSSLTTEETTLGLLGTIPLNCGSLGVAFSQSFLENPLTKVNTSLERITIELRDERNLPYYSGNNSIITLYFKVLY